MALSIWHRRRVFFHQTIVIFGILATGTLLFASVGEAAPKDKERWEHKYGTKEYIFGKAPVAFLQDHLHLLHKGKALDIAMGEGRNGVFLATKGYQVTGSIDISETGLNKARALAKEQEYPSKQQWWISKSINCQLRSMMSLFAVTTYKGTCFHR